MRTKFSAPTAAASGGNALPRPSTAWGLMLLALVLLLAGPLQRVTRADSFELKFDDGPAKKEGTIKVTVKWKKDGLEKSVTVAATINKDDNSAAIRNKVRAALNADARISADFSLTDTGLVEAGVTLYEGTIGLAKPGVQVIESSVENPDGIGGISLSAGLRFASAETGTQGFFRVGGGLADVDDQLSVKLVNASGGIFSSADVFTLPSYSGLSPEQIMLGLADLIDLNPNYSASFADGEVLIFGNFNPEFGVDLVFSDMTNGTLAGETGVRAVPEPTTILLAGTGLAGVAASMRRRRRSGRGQDT
jgi:hypothetical protein